MKYALLKISILPADATGPAVSIQEWTCPCCGAENTEPVGIISLLRCGACKRTSQAKYENGTTASWMADALLQKQAPKGGLNIDGYDL